MRHDFMFLLKVCVFVLPCYFVRVLFFIYLFFIFMCFSCLYACISFI